jgi:hypothetical protein
MKTVMNPTKDELITVESLVTQILSDLVDTGNGTLCSDYCVPLEGRVFWLDQTIQNLSSDSPFGKVVEDLLIRWRDSIQQELEGKIA